MKEGEDDLVGQLFTEAVERMRRQGVPPPVPADPPTIHYSELPEAKPDNPLFREWNFYQREVGRLLAVGLGGKWVLIKGETILGVWDTKEEADSVWAERFLTESVLIHQVQERERLILCTRLFHPGFLNPCRS